MTVKARSAFRISKLSEHIGAEVVGVDLSRPIDEETRREMAAALDRHLALVVRDQKLSPQQFLAAAVLFGEPMERYFSDHDLPDVPFVHEVSNRHRNKDGSLRKVGPRWHTDHTNQECPPKYTCLYAVELPSKGGGGTSVANMRAAYDALPADLRARIDGMQTANVPVAKAAASGVGTVERNMRDNANVQPEIFHPLVRTHEVDGHKALFFHPTKTEYVVGMGPEESQTFLDGLLEKALRPEFVYSHQYRLGDMLIWDNRAAMHKANYDYDPEDESQHRLLYRVLIKGERPH